MKAANWMVMTALGCSLAACGGGGTSTGTSTNSYAGRGDGGGGLNNYAGAQNDAALSAMNENYFTKLMLFSFIESSFVGVAFNGTSARPSVTENANTLEANTTEVPEEMVTWIEQQVFKKNAQARPSPLNVTYRCAGGGNVNLSGDYDKDVGAGVLSLNYGKCIVNGTLKRGMATFVVNASDKTYDKFLDYTLQYDGLTVETNKLLFLYTGSHQVLRTFTNGILTKFVVTSDLKRLEQTTDWESVDQTVNTTTASGMKMEGRLCDEATGCVGLSTRILFNINNGLTAGEMKMVGVGGSNIKVSASGGRLLSSVDGEGNGKYSPTKTISF